MPRVAVTGKGRMTDAQVRLLRAFGVADFWGRSVGERGSAHNVSDDGRVYDYGFIPYGSRWSRLR